MMTRFSWEFTRANSEKFQHDHLAISYWVLDQIFPCSFRECWRRKPYRQSTYGLLFCKVYVVLWLRKIIYLFICSTGYRSLFAYKRWPRVHFDENKEIRENNCVHYKCFYTIKVRAKTNWSIAQYITKTRKKIFNWYIELSVSVNICLMQKFRSLYIPNVWLFPSEKFQKKTFLYVYNWIQRLKKIRKICGRIFRYVSVTFSEKKMR